MSLDAKQKFSQAMNRLGLIPPKHIIADAKLHSCLFESDTQIPEDGWYIFSEKKPAMGLFGCWGIKRARRWLNKKYASMTTDQRTEYIDRLYAMRKERNRHRASRVETLIHEAVEVRCDDPGCQAELANKLPINY